MLTLPKIEKTLFFAIILFLPTQIGKHFWPQWSFVDAIRIDYLSPTLYLTDILIAALFVLWFSSRIMATVKNSKFKMQNYSSKLKIFNFKLSLLTFHFALLTLVVGIFLSQSPIVGFYKLLKIIEFAFLGWYVATHFAKKDFATVAMLLATGVVLESALAIAQFFKQASLGGIFWFFGERTFSGQTPGIANANIDGRLVLRPYATFPHPNVLAGYLVIAMTMIVQSAKFKVQSLREALLLISILLGSITLLLTLSRAAIVLWLFIAAFLLRKKLFTFHFSLFTLLIVGIISFSPLPPRFASLFTTDQQSLVRRQELNTAAIEMFKNSPVVGVGLNNFLVELPNYQKPTAGPLWLQPVHNIFLLLAAETGLTGLLLFLWLLLKTFMNLAKKKEFHPPTWRIKFQIVLVILVLGFFDHYFLTLQQGQLLLTMAFGFAWTKQ